MSTTGWVTRISAPTPQYACNMCGTLPDIKSAKQRRLSPPPTSTLGSCALLDTGKLKDFTDNLGRFARYLSFWTFKKSTIGSPNLHARGRITGFLSYRAGCYSSNFKVLRVIEAESIAHELELAEAE